MEKEHVKVFTDTPIIVDRLKYILKENNILSIIKSDKIVGYEISNNFDELYILNSDVERAAPIIENFKKEIAE